MVSGWVKLITSVRNLISIMMASFHSRSSGIRAWKVGTPAVAERLPSDSVKMFVFVNRKTEMPPYLVPLEYGGSWESLSDKQEDLEARVLSKDWVLDRGSRVRNSGSILAELTNLDSSLRIRGSPGRAFSFFLQCSGPGGSLQPHLRQDAVWISWRNGGTEPSYTSLLQSTHSALASRVTWYESTSDIGSNL